MLGGDVGPWVPAAGPGLGVCIGFGGPIVPKRIEARCFAPPLPPPPRSDSSSESEEESTTDQSSSSAGDLTRREAVDVSVGADAIVSPADLDWDCVRRWKGFLSVDDA